MISSYMDSMVTYGTLLCLLFFACGFVLFFLFFLFFFVFCFFCFCFPLLVLHTLNLLESSLRMDVIWW
jgi:hypothetical protein